MRPTSRLMNTLVIMMTDEQYLNANDAEELFLEEEGDEQEEQPDE